MPETQPNVPARPAVVDRWPSLQPYARGARSPLSFAQEGIWLAHQLHGTSAEYNLSWAWRLRGDLDRAALSRAFDDLVARHETLRTRFEEVDGEPAQVVQRPAPLPISFDDLSGLTEDERGARVQEAMRDELRTSFDLTTGAMLRVRLLKLAAHEHVLLRTVHHIVYDAWSHGVFNRELAASYGAARLGQIAELPPLHVQYADVAIWQRACLTGPRVADSRAYWSRQLTGITTQLSLPADRRGSRYPAAAQAIDIALPLPSMSAIKGFARNGGASTYMTMLAGFAALLAYYGGRDDLLIGSPVANRATVDTEALVGLFSSVLPIRIAVGAGTTFRQLLAQVRDTMFDAFQHQQALPEALAHGVPAQANRAGRPLCQVLFAIQDAPWITPRLADLDVDLPFRVDTFLSPFDLEVQVFPRGNDSRLRWVYNADRFDRWRMEQMARHYLRALSVLIAQPDAAVERVLSASADAVRIDTAATASAAEETALDASAADLVAAQAARTPDGTAVVCGAQSLTYAELGERVNRLSQYLTTLGVGPECLVGIMLERSTDLVVSVLATLGAGGAFVPLDPDYPLARLRSMVNDAAPLVVLTTTSLHHRLALDTRVVLLDAPAIVQAVAAQPATRPACRVRPQHAAYVIYTSGSTGQPKGVVNTHEGLTNRLLWGQHAYPLSGGDRVLQKTPHSFDVSVWELLGPLMAGATLVIAAPGEHREPLQMQLAITNERITTVHFVPSMLHALLELPDSGGSRHLRRVVCSGEALSADLQRRFFERFPDTELVNLYGPTETSIEVSSWACRVEDAAVRPPIGYAIWNTRLDVLDAQFSSVPRGVPGELYIAGRPVARGYLGRPALTAERFLPDPHADGGRMYRTGDLAQSRPDGAFEYLGRRDHQIKLRGVRIELGEIEAALLAQPSVARAVAHLQDDGTAEPQLVAYVTSPANQLAEPAALRVALSRSLPEHMVPMAIVVLDALPLTLSGKVDRQALPRVAATARTAYRAPRTVEEAALCSIVAEVLGLAQIGIDDDFFEMGGHSLAAARVISRVRARSGREISFRTILDKGTIARISDETQIAKSQTM